MTFATYFNPGISLQGGGSSGGGGAASLPISGNGATITTSTPLVDGTQTWNNAAVTFTGIKANITDTASNAASLLMDLQVGGSSIASVRKDGRLISSTYSQQSGRAQIDALGQGGFVSGSLYGFNWSSGSTGGAVDTRITRKDAANLRFGAADAAAPVAQTLSVQSVVAGTTNTAGANLTITGSQGTGTGAGGSIVFQVAPAGGSGTAQNALATALTIDSARLATFAGSIRVDGGSVSDAAIKIGNPNTGFFGAGSGAFVVAAGNVEVARFQDNGQLRLPSSISLSWNSDTFLNRDGVANTLALRNAANAQEMRVYNTFTSSTNFERFRIFAQSAAAVLVGTEKGSAGGTARALELQTDATSRLALDTVGSAQIVTALTVATLPGTPLTGMMARVTDALAPAVGVTVASGGAAQALCWYNGANWTVIGV